MENNKKRMTKEEVSEIKSEMYVVLNSDLEHEVKVRKVKDLIVYYYEDENFNPLKQILKMMTESDVKISVDVFKYLIEYRMEIALELIEFKYSRYVAYDAKIALNEEFVKDIKFLKENYGISYKILAEVLEIPLVTLRKKLSKKAEYMISYPYLIKLYKKLLTYMMINFVFENKGENK